MSDIITSVWSVYHKMRKREVTKMDTNAWKNTEPSSLRVTAIDCNFPEESNFPEEMVDGARSVARTV